MLLLDQATNKVLLEEGQILVPLDAFTLDRLKVEKIFENALYKFADYVPHTKKLTSFVGSGGIILEDAQEIISVKVSVNKRMNRGTPFIPWYDQVWDWDPQSKLFTSIYDANFDLKYLAYYIFDYVDISYIQRNISLNSPQLIFDLRGNYQPGTLKFIIDDEEFTEGTITDNVLTLLSNKTGSGSINLLTLRVTLSPDATTIGNLIIEFTSLYKGVEELSIKSKYFLEMYAYELLTALANIKQDTKIEGLPFDITTDDLINRARTLKDTLLAERHNVEMKWYEII